MASGPLPSKSPCRLHAAFRVADELQEGVLPEIAAGGPENVELLEERQDVGSGGGRRGGSGRDVSRRTCRLGGRPGPEQVFLRRSTVNVQLAAIVVGRKQVVSSHAW